MNESRKWLDEFLTFRTNGEYKLVTNSPGDGKTRYRVVKAGEGYFNAGSYVTAVGLSEANTMVKAFVFGCESKAVI